MISLRKSVVLAGVAACALLLSACSLYKTSSNGGQSSTGNKSEQQSAGQIQQSQGEVAATVTFSDNGFSPSTVTIKFGQAIKWVNSGSSAVQVSSDPHPTHNDNRELTNGQSVLEIAPGASATATLTKTGSWGYHNHLNPSTRGKVVVQ